MSYRYFENRDCEYYPCHPDRHINCLFCFCPLYGKDDCGGSPQWIAGKNGKKIKDCSGCILPHRPEAYDYIMTRLMQNE